jgi:hypothetical protein
MEKDNHHFVPQGYLRGFTIEGEKSLIWEYVVSISIMLKKMKMDPLIMNLWKMHFQNSYL